MTIAPYFSEGWNSIARIDIEALKHNLNVLRDKSGGATIKQMAVVKANAYGHGLTEVAIAVHEVVDWFGVATVMEGAALRRVGIMKPIMVFGSPYSESVHFYKEYGLTAVVSSLSHFERLEPGTHYHVKFDTGMGRIGVLQDELEACLLWIDRRSDLILGGLMTHFASAEDVDTTIFDMQNALFNELIKRFGPNNLLIHAANSAASLHRANVGYDMIRSGVAMYGFDPTGEYNPILKPALEWISRLAQVRFLRKGQGISYSHSFHLPHDGWVGVIPVGYADGLPRRLRNRMYVSINGKRYPQVGNITMDQIMIWLDQDQLPVDSQVLLMGGTNDFSVYRWAQLMGTIPYEITTAIGNRVIRVIQ